MMRGRTGKPFYKKWWVWLLAVIVIGIAFSGGEEERESVAGDVSGGNPAVLKPVEEEPEVDEVDDAVVEENEAEEEQPAIEEPEPLPEENDGATLGEKNAQNYLDFTAFSYKGLIQQLEFEGFTNEEAVHGADSCGADWKEQAAVKAKDYLGFSSFSRSELIAQLEFEGFTSEEALYGVEAVGY